MTNDEARRHGWIYDGSQRPPFATSPGPGQESIWDYPRPPALVADGRHVQVFLGERLVADTRQAFRVLETAGAPTFYLPPADVDHALLVPSDGHSYCEWKGVAQYWHVTDGTLTAANGAWAYPDADARYADIAGYVAFYLGVLSGHVDGEQAQPQPGGFYGGWVTSDVVGPFKGEAGTQGW